MRIDDVPLTGYTASSVMEDSAVGTKIVLNGSDSDTKHVSFILTELPTKGRLYKTTGEPINYPYSPFQVRKRPRKARSKRLSC